jgi:hypothetical protein
VQKLGISVLVTPHQAGKLVMVRTLFVVASTAV